MNNKGVTLIELLVVLLIISILAAIALPTLLNQITKAKYVQSIVDLTSLRFNVQQFRLKYDRYPHDVYPNEPFEGLQALPLAPFGSYYDYDFFRLSNNDCLVQVVFFGEDKIRQTPAWSKSSAKLGEIGMIGDDRILVIADGDCDDI